MAGIYSTVSAVMWLYDHIKLLGFINSISKESTDIKSCLLVILKLFTALIGDILLVIQLIRRDYYSYAAFSLGVAITIFIIVLKRYR
jgi:hypothetical protein